MTNLEMMCEMRLPEGKDMVVSEKVAFMRGIATEEKSIDTSVSSAYKNLGQGRPKSE